MPACQGCGAPPRVPLSFGPAIKCDLCGMPLPSSAAEMYVPRGLLAGIGVPEAHPLTLWLAEADDAANQAQIIRTAPGAPVAATPLTIQLRSRSRWKS